MEKLEVGKWYRFDNGRFSAIFSETAQGNSNIVIFQGNEIKIYIDRNGEPPFNGYETLETLTPKEALILLANGFVLEKKENYLYAIKDDCLKHNNQGGKGKWFAAVSCLSLTGFTIHALPSEGK